MITEVFIENYPVDITQDISSLLTFALDDIRNFGSRQTAFSKTVVLPGTARNNALFGNIFETGHSNDYNSGLPNISTNFNASKSAKCIIFQDNLQTFKGTIRMLEIVTINGVPEYEMALNGELTSLAVSLSGAYLTDLDFSEYNTPYTAESIVNSWDNTPGSGVYFPLIDYGRYSTLKHDWDIKTFRPALYAKEYIDKMFAAADFRYDCDLFNTSRFKSLVVPCGKKNLLQLSTPFLIAAVAAPFGFSSSSTGGVMQHANFQSHGFSIDGSFEQITYLPVGSAVFNGTYAYSFRCTANIGGDRLFVVNFKINGVAQTLDYHVVRGGTSVVINGGFSISETITQDDVLTIEVVKFDNLDINVLNAVLFLSSTTQTYNEILVGADLIINLTIPQNVKQIDFFTSIIKLFNLYVYEDRFDNRLLHITPYIDFFSTDSGNAIDWSYKLDRNETVKIKPMSELTAKTYKFNYKDDNDYWNDLYKKRYGKSYGSYIFESPIEYTEQSKSVDLIFSGTPLVGYASEDKVYSTILKRSGNEEENTDSNIRLLQTKKITGVESWNIKNGIVVLDTLTSYGYAGHLDDPDAPTNDLNFGAVNELFFTLAGGSLQVNQFNVYWSPYMAEITDKDSKMLSGKFYLTPVDINQLDFSKYIYLDGVLWRLMKIEDYNASKPDTCKVELLKVINTVY